jgi:D-3-phosphoglycerate dehydrogenase
LGIIGYGHIGSQVSVLAESMGMHVVFYDVVKKLTLGNSKQMENLDDLLRLSDFVSLHVPELPSTKNMMGAREMKKMKKGAFLLNASRGTVVEIDSLVAALKESHLAGAAVDVFPIEPVSNNDVFDSPLRGLKNVILTPHIGGSTEEAQESIGVEVSDSISKFINNGSTRGAVNFPNVDLPVFDGCHRVLNVHQNVPGVMKNINNIVSELGANIRGQFLSTDNNIGYLVMDLEKAGGDEVAERIRKLPTSIKTRILY